VVLDKKVEKISWTDGARQEEVLHKVKEKMNTLHTTNRRKANWIGHILRRNCLLKVTEGKIEEGTEATAGQGGRSTQLLYDLTKMRGHWTLKEEALDRTVWRTHFGKDYGPVVRQTTE
jgi:hypothetical protein